jgi:hypothetical protein
MNKNLLLYGAAAFILFRVIKMRRENAAAAAAAAAAANFERIKGSSAAKAEEFTTQQGRTSM